MTKNEISQSIKNYTDGSPFISISQFAKMMHIGRDSARTMLADLEFVVNGKRKDYFVNDVARMLNERKQLS